MYNIGKNIFIIIISQMCVGTYKNKTCNNNKSTTNARRTPIAIIVLSYNMYTIL